MEITIGKWVFEVTSLKGRKTEEFGHPFSAVASISIVNGEVHIEGLLSTGKPEKCDFKSINEIVKLLGYSYYVKSSIEDGERITKNIKV